MGWKIVTGSDNAGYGHKSALKELLESDPRVDEVIDVGVTGREDGTYYPNVAVEAAEKIAAGEADRALLVCGTGRSASRSRRTRSPASVPSPRTTCTRCSARCSRTMRRSCAWVSVWWASSSPRSS